MNYESIHQGVHAASALMGIPVSPVPQPPVKPDHVKDFVALARQITGHKPFRVFDDWCEMGYCAFAALTTGDPDRRDALAQQAAQVESKYPPDQLRVMSEMMGVAKEALKDGGDDFLGRVCGLMGALDGGVGQFFTPFDSSLAMVRMTAPDVPAVIAQDGHFCGADPAAGSGGLLVAMADHAYAAGADPDDVFFEGVELVPATYHMLYIQLTLAGVAARAVCGNSLTQETTEYAYTPRALRFIRKHGLGAAATTMRLACSAS